MELLNVADAVARDKNIDREGVIEAMEQAIEKAARTKYGLENDIRAKIDRKSGEVNIARYREVVDTVENELIEISLEDARQANADIEVGEFEIDPLPPMEFGRIAAQTARQVIFQKVKEAERARQYNDYIDRKGEIVNGIVKRVEYGGIYIDIGQAEAFMKSNDVLPNERFRNGDRVRAYIADVVADPKGPQVLLSRTHPMFLAKLFAQEVPEVYDGVIEIKSAARDPGSRAKISVSSNDEMIDPVGACVGLKGNRVRAIVEELAGEKIDIVPWVFDLPTFAVNALSPADVTKVVLDEDNKKIEAVVPDDQFSLAVGRKGQNVRLASGIIGWKIEIITESDRAKKDEDEQQHLSELFSKALDVDEDIVSVLIAEGFAAVEEIAYIELEDMAAIEVFDEGIAAELISRAKNYLDTAHKDFVKEAKKQKVTKDLIDFELLSDVMKKQLVDAGVKTLDDLADLAGDELIEIVGTALTLDEANKVIMAAREHWFKDEEQEEA